MMIIRFGNKISYLKNLIYTILLHNTIIYFYILMTVIISLNVFGNFIYSFTNLDKLIYVVLKLYILIQIYSIFYALFFKTFNEKIIFFLSFVFIMSIIFCSSYNIPFYLGYHFVNDVNLSSFIIFAIINIFLIYYLFKYSIKRMDRIGE